MEGGEKAEAVATVVAAVDLARVRQPVSAEGAGAGDEAALEVEVECQGPPEPTVTSELQRVQVGGVPEVIT